MRIVVASWFLLLACGGADAPRPPPVASPGSGFGSSGLVLRVADVAGIWHGTSTCLVQSSACRDEDVVYQFTAKGEALSVAADRLVRGEPHFTGDLDCTLEPAASAVRCEIPNNKGTFVYTVDGDRIHGRLDLPDGTRFRTVEVRRAAPPISCEHVVDQRADYKLCDTGDRFTELVNLGRAWTTGESVPRGRIRDRQQLLLLLGGDCKTDDDAPEPAHVCLFGRWHNWVSTRDSYGFPDALASRTGFPRQMLLASYGRVVAINAENIGVIGLHSKDWRLAPLAPPFAATCSPAILASPLTRGSAGYELGVKARCSGVEVTSIAHIHVMEDSNRVTVTWESGPGGKNRG